MATVLSVSHQYTMCLACGFSHLGGWFLYRLKPVQRLGHTALTLLQEQQKSRNCLSCIVMIDWVVATSFDSSKVFSSNYKLGSFMTQVKSNLKVLCGSKPVYNIKLHKLSIYSFFFCSIIEV